MRRLLFVCLVIAGLVGSFVIGAFWSKHNSPSAINTIQIPSLADQIIRDAPPIWQTVELDGFSVEVPYSPDWTVSGIGISVDDKYDSEVYGINFGRPINNSHSVGREYTLTQYPREDLDNGPGVMDHSGCYGASSRATVGNARGVMFFQGGATWCSLNFAFTVGSHTYYLEQRVDKFGLPPKEIGDEMSRIIQSVAEPVYLSRATKQLTKEQVLNGFDPCGVQFFNGSISLDWNEFLRIDDEHRRTIGSSWESWRDSCDAGSYLEADNIKFTDLDGDGMNEALVPARVVQASSGGVIYVFKNVAGDARVVDRIELGKGNGEITLVNKNLVKVDYQEFTASGLIPAKATYRFVNGHFIKQ